MDYVLNLPIKVCCEIITPSIVKPIIDEGLLSSVVKLDKELEINGLCLNEEENQYEDKEGNMYHRTTSVLLNGFKKYEKATEIASHCNSKKNISERGNYNIYTSALLQAIDTLYL